MTITRAQRDAFANSEAGKAVQEYVGWRMAHISTPGTYTTGRLNESHDALIALMLPLIEGEK